MPRIVLAADSCKCWDFPVNYNIIDKDNFCLTIIYNLVPLQYPNHHGCHFPQPLRCPLPFQFPLQKPLHLECRLHDARGTRHPFLLDAPDPQDSIHPSWENAFQELVRGGQCLDVHLQHHQESFEDHYDVQSFEDHYDVQNFLHRNLLYFQSHCLVAEKLIRFPDVRGHGDYFGRRWHQEQDREQDREQHREQHRKQPNHN